MSAMRLLAAAALVCTVLALHCSAGSPSRKHLEANFNPRVPAGWTSRALTAAEYETTIDLTIALRNENTEALTELLEAVSDPRSASYGNYLTWKEVGALVAPSKQTVSTVLAWLHENNVSDAEFRGTGDFVRILLTIAEAERLLETSFVALASAADERPIYRSLSPYSVPAHVGASIDFVAGVYGTAGLVGEGVRVQAQRSALATDVTPAVVKSMTYSTGVVGSSPNNTISVAEFLDQYYSPSDLEQFQQQYDLTVQPVDVVDGPNDSSSPGLEAQLDIEYVMACGENIPTWFISTPGRHELQEPFLTWLQDMEATPNAPWIFSVSFGDVESTISADYASRCEQEFQKFGATGRTVFFASGDDGVGCSGCPDSATLEPNWPATSQYVTAVGGMRLQGDGGLEGDSIASGGFSNLFPQASWQADAVQAYISSSQMPANEVYNVTGRAVPDIAAFSESVRIVIDGFNMGIGGTSCAAPQVAGIFGLINDLRLQNGMPTMGFLNPWIYQVAAEHDDAFTDVTTGINSHECCTGFPAGPGWDPITGWGLPNYETLSQYALQA